MNRRTLAADRRHSQRSIDSAIVQLSALLGVSLPVAPEGAEGIDAEVYELRKLQVTSQVLHLARLKLEDALGVHPRRRHGTAKVAHKRSELLEE